MTIRDRIRKQCNNPEHFDRLVDLMSNAETDEELGEIFISCWADPSYERKDILYAEKYVRENKKTIKECDTKCGEEGTHEVDGKFYCKDCLIGAYILNKNALKHLNALKEKNLQLEEKIRAKTKSFKIIREVKQGEHINYAATYMMIGNLGEKGITTGPLAGFVYESIHPKKVYEIEFNWEEEE